MAMATATRTVVGVFSSRDAAERAIQDLRSAGYRDDQIGMVGRDIKIKGLRHDTEETNAEEGLAVGAVVGTAAGAAVGVGILAGVIPVIGPAIVAGTFGTILSNALAGAAVAGVAGALIGWGIPDEDAQFYEDEVKSGRYLVTVNTDNGADPRPILAQHGGYERPAPVM